MARPDDLVPLADAARAVDRSTSTLRRWIRSDRLTRWEGALPAHGGSAPALVSLAEVHGLVVSTGRQPHRPASSRPAPEHEPGDGLTLREAADQLRDDLADATVQLARHRERADLLAVELDRLRSDLDRERRERAEWRDRCDALDAEARELRAMLREAEGDARELRARQDERQRRRGVVGWALDRVRGG